MRVILGVQSQTIPHEAFSTNKTRGLLHAF